MPCLTISSSAGVRLKVASCRATIKADGIEGFLLFGLGDIRGECRDGEECDETAMMSLFMVYLSLNMYLVIAPGFLAVGAGSLRSIALQGTGKTARPQAAPRLPND